MTHHDGALDHALALLETMPLLDGHNDLPFVIRVHKGAPGDLAAYDMTEARTGRDTDIPKMRAGRVSAQVWAAFVPPKEPKPASFALQQIALVRRMNARYPDVFAPCLRAADIAAAKKDGRIASLISIENGAAIENRIDTLYAFYDIGVRLMTLCHNATTDWCDSATDAPRHNGLTAFGEAVVRAMNDIGMLVDLAHVSPAVMHKALDISRAPLVWSHSNAATLCSHPRNVPDDVLDRVAANGGIVMATFVPNFICQNSHDWLRPFKDSNGATKEGVDLDAAVPEKEGREGAWPRGTLVQYCDHLDYLAKRIGHDHVGIGSDFFGGPQGPGLEDMNCFPNILAELVRRGWRDDALTKLAAGNFIRVFEAVEQAAA